MDEELLRRKYQHLTRRLLGHFLERLFAEYTGLHFHTAWAPARFQDWDGRRSPTGCSICCRLAARGPNARLACRACAPKQLARVLRRQCDSFQFKCRFGVRNCWVPIRVRGMTIGIAFLQTLGGARLKPTTSSHPALTASEFRRAGRLLSLMVQHVQTLDLAELRKSELTAAGQAVVGLEREQTRLRQALQRHLPAPEPVTRRSRPQTHTEQVVQRLLETVSHDYAQPLTLRGCAAKLGMNAAYLSALFSRAVGRPFKTFLTEFRMKNARALLSDPAQTVSGVAGAVGYGSENQFRLAFKKATGLAPRLWRQALRTQPLAVIL